MVQSVEQSYAYPFASKIEGQGRALHLAATGSPAGDPVFFQGQLQQPEVAAALLLAVSDIALQRYYYPPGMVAAMIRAADPVVTVAEGRLRFESFSQCCGVYARADFLADSLAISELAKGTTNVDFNAPMRAALAKVRSSGRMALEVTSKTVAVQTDSDSEIEHKVKLPVRWLKGFAEVHVLASRLGHRATLTAPQARRFLSSLPNQVKAREPVWLVASGAGLRLSQRPSDDGIASASLGRLASLKPLARLASQMHIYSAPGGTSGFELDFGPARFMLVLSPLASRGFSGEGQLLELLSVADSEAAIARVRAALNWQTALKRSDLVAELGISDRQADIALAMLAARGLIGADPRDGCYYHRVLPFDMSAVETLFPRLKSARSLHEAGAVADCTTKQGKTSATVKSGDTLHRVSFDEDQFKCTCLWHSRTLGESGPCKHVLAAMIESGSDFGE